MILGHIVAEPIKEVMSSYSNEGLLDLYNAEQTQSTYCTQELTGKY